MINHNKGGLFPFMLGVMLVALIRVSQARAHEPHKCPPGFNDSPALAAHLEQDDVLKMPFSKVFAAGQVIFVTNFNACDGAGRPGTNGGVTPRTPDPLMGPRFTRVSAPEASSCAGCHNQPQAGGAGDFVANVFVLAQNLIPVAATILNPDFSQTFAERNTLGMFGSGAIELLGREMTQDLIALRSQAINGAVAGGTDVPVALV